MSIRKIRDDFYHYRKKQLEINLQKKIFERLLVSEKKYGKRFETEWNEKTLYLNENTSETVFDRHYIYHTAWAFRKILQIRPDFHTDIGSSLYFIGMLSSVIPVRFYDYRPAKLDLENLKYGKADLLILPFDTGSISCLSCMHVIEHIGLGRYGDQIDYDGDLKAINELIRVTSPNGYILFVVPIGGKARIMFNAHRIYRHQQIQDLFKKCRLVEFVLIPDNEEQGSLVHNPSDELLKVQKYGCGCYLFQK